MSREIKFRAWQNEDSMMLSWNELKVVTLDYAVTMPHLELMQYTGLKDKNGVEIYEGDWLRFTSAHSGHSVEFRIGSYYWGSTLLGFAAHMTEVIGNIHENPELLEAES